jgi:hypothetical protein
VACRGYNVISNLDESCVSKVRTASPFPSSSTIIPAGLERLANLRLATIALLVVGLSLVSLCPKRSNRAYTVIFVVEMTSVVLVTIVVLIDVSTPSKLRTDARFTNLVWVA